DEHTVGAPGVQAVILATVAFAGQLRRRCAPPHVAVDDGLPAALGPLFVVAGDVDGGAEVPVRHPGLQIGRGAEVRVLDDGEVGQARDDSPAAVPRAAEELARVDGDAGGVGQAQIRLGPLVTLDAAANAAVHERDVGVALLPGAVELDADVVE